MLDAEDLDAVEWADLDTARARMPEMYPPVREHLEAVLGGSKSTGSIGQPDAADIPSPPVDSDGQVIGDLPWKFFDPVTTAAAASLRRNPDLPL